MPINNKEPPEAARAAVLKVVGTLNAARAFRTPNLRRADPATIQLTMAHRSAELPLTSLAGERPGGVLWRGWRFIITDKSQQPLAAAEATQVGMGEYRFAELNEGPYVAATAESLRRAVNLAELTDGSFEPVLLVTPALRAASLWLKRTDGPADGLGPADLLLPLPPAPERLAPFRPLRTGDFLAILRRLAAMVPQDDTRGG
jgi:hypothetical protein